MGFNEIEEALTAIQKGKIVIVVDDQEREHEGDLVASAESATQETINFMVTYGRGLVCVPLEKTIAEALELSPMVKRNHDPLGTAFTVSVDHVDTTTGISAAQRALTIRRLSSPDAKMEEFRVPGHVFPLIAVPGGVLARPGHTEAAIDLVKSAGLRPVAVICEILKEDGTMARTDDLFQFATLHDLPIISVDQLIAWIRSNAHHQLYADNEKAS